MADPNNPLNITDEDIGKEGRFLIDGNPSVLIGLVNDENGTIYTSAFKVTYDTGRTAFFACSLTRKAITRVARKLYIGVARELSTGGVFNTTWACQTRKEAECVMPSGWTIIEIPHPEDAP